MYKNSYILIFVNALDNQTIVLHLPSFSKPSKSSYILRICYMSNFCYIRKKGRTFEIEGSQKSYPSKSSYVFTSPFNTTFTVILDRKSTRLNSRHVPICYAVFCLNKKITHTVD